MKRKLWWRIKFDSPHVRLQSNSRKPAADSNAHLFYLNVLPEACCHVSLTVSVSSSFNTRAFPLLLLCFNEAIKIQQLTLNEPVSLTQGC